MRRLEETQRLNPKDKAAIEAGKKELEEEFDAGRRDFEDDFGSVKRSDDYGHLRFGRSQAVKLDKKSPDYGHMRFGR